jgi:hypothetical protein
MNTPPAQAGEEGPITRLNKSKCYVQEEEYPPIGNHPGMNVLSATKTRELGPTRGT